MTTLTKAEKQTNYKSAIEILEVYAPYIQDGSALLLISQEIGKGLTDYLRVSLAYTDTDGKVQSGYLTWAISNAFGYSLRDRNGMHYLGIHGIGFSKADEIARTLASFYGVSSVRYGLN